MSIISLELRRQLSTTYDVFQVLRPSKRKDDVVLAITTTGTVKVWTLIGNENKYSEPIYENESKEVLSDKTAQEWTGFNALSTIHLDSMPERDHVELLLAKSEDRSDCLRKVLANL